MRISIFFLAAFGAGFSTTVFASSLATCRSIESHDARSDCYDRIAAAETSTPVISNGRLDGAYAGGSISFGGANESTYSRDWWSGADYNFRLNSPSIGAFAGYNRSVGNLVLGVEASLQADTSWRATPDYSSISGSSSDYYTPEFLARIQGLIQSGDTGIARIDLPTWYIGEKTTIWYDIKEIAAPTISARTGAGFGNVLVYGRGGIGASYMSARVHSRTGDGYCDEGFIDVNYGPIGAWSGGPLCNSERVVDDETTVTKRSRLAPTFAAAIGAEYHRDKYFGRLEAEARYIHWGNTFLPSGDSGTMRYQIGMGVGVRF